MSFSKEPSTYQPEGIDQAILDKLAKGLMAKDDWVKSKRIEEVLKISASEVRHYVNHMRQIGMPVVSSSKGYKYTCDPAEIDDCLAHLYSRARAIRDAATGLQKAKYLLTGIREGMQPDLFEYMDSTKTT